ncbi:MAG TPA: bifunctional oligoribonuclease/PAP phosphatase NrnA [Desulfitobacteriaceae bacterium]|nr:bifunctional oligoribonuclease/PAP phosphatase NrnA [Desulfitobacteriaceae bacterium]
MSNSFSEMITELKKASRVALFSHVSPDGDCIGSMLALGRALEKLQKQVYFYYNVDSLPANLRFLPGAARIVSVLPAEWPEVLIFVDCTDFDRVHLSREDLPPACLVLNIDHHISNNFFGHVNCIDSKAGAAGEVMFRIINALGVELDKEIATNLYAAIVTDTGSFLYTSTTAQTHRIAAELIEQKIELSTIHSRLFDQKPLAFIKLLQRALASLQFYNDGQIALITLSNQDFQECGAGDDLSEGIVNHARSIEGVEVAILIRERDSQDIKVVFRSNSWFDCNEVAMKFQGGGHTKAAGCTLKLSLAETQTLILQAVQEVLLLWRLLRPDKLPNPD